MRRLMLVTLLFCLTSSMAVRKASAQVSAYAGPSPFYYAAYIYPYAEADFYADDPEGWCTEDWGCYWSSFTYVEISNGDHYDYGDGWYFWASAGTPDPGPGLAMLSSGYYAHAYTSYTVWLCWDECYNEWDFEDEDWQSAEVDPAWVGCGNDGWGGTTHILSQYYEGGWGSPYQPGCGYPFTNDVLHSSNYPFGAWKSQYGAYDYVEWDWALLSYDVVYNVDCLEVYYWGVPMGLNSGYRTPAHNAASGGAANSQHTTGYAADLNIHPYSDWSWLRTQAKSGAICDVACVEPYDGTHLHVEYTGGSCPGGW